MLVDFHLHTTCSDGVWSPQQLFEEIRRRKLEAFCVSDHDNLDAYPIPPDLEPIAIAGLEVDSCHDGRTVHLLAYGINDVDSPLLRALRKQRDARVDRMKMMISRCNDLGLEITMDDVLREAKGAASLGRPHLARSLVSRGMVASTQEAFDRYLADDGDGFVPLERLSAERIIALIRASGGVAVVAHPKRLAAPHHLGELIDLGVDGIEIDHPTADVADRRRYTDIARANSLLVTGGSDFHAPVPERSIGIELPAEDVRALQAAIGARVARTA